MTPYTSPSENSDLQGAQVLLVDDTPENLKVLRQMLEAEGCDILIAASGADALEIARSGAPDLILLDVMMPGMDGFETCRRLKKEAATRSIPVIFVTARTDASSVVEGFEVGGLDYILKPFNAAEVISRTRTHLRIDRLSRQLKEKNEALSEMVAQLRREITARNAMTRERDQLAEHLSMVSRSEAERWGIEGFVGNSRTIRQIMESVGRVQHVETTVLITGENGTGKELIARAIHFGGVRANGPFIVVNCAAIPRDLAESMFFGHVKGAFTGADRERKGCFRLAHQGTLFLDEIGDMPEHVQGKLLRVLEEGAVTPVGGEQAEAVDVRVLAATNMDLRSRMAAGAFRQDLYFRLARFTVTVPPLRERREDIPLLVRHFLDLLSHEMRVQMPALTPEVVQALVDYDFPGNVRELKNILERAMIESAGQAIGPAHLHFFSYPLTQTEQAPPAQVAEGSEDGLPLNLPDAEKVLIERALVQTGGNITRAAKLLGINRTRIYRYIREHPR